MKYNHAYTIAFSVDTDEEDPHEVPPQELIASLRRRTNNLSRPDGLGHYEILEAVDPYDTICYEEEKALRLLTDLEERLIACLRNLVDRDLIKDTENDHYEEVLELLKEVDAAEEEVIKRGVDNEKVKN